MTIRKTLLGTLGHNDVRIAVEFCERGTNFSKVLSRRWMGISGAELDGYEDPKDETRKLTEAFLLLIRLLEDKSHDA